MKGTSLLMMLVVLSAPLRADVITEVSIHSVSSEYTQSPWDLRAVHVIDGSGLSGSPAGHAVTENSGNSWQTISMTGTGDIQFDLGRICTLTNVHVWNLTFYEPYNGRGANEVIIRTSTNAIDWNTEGTYGFSRASGVAGDLGFDIDPTGWQAARYIDFQIQSNFGGSDNGGHVGLSEVRFFEATEPPVPIRITGLSFDNHTVTLWLENCTPGASNSVLCTEDPTTQLQWDNCTNFVSQADACIVSVPFTNAVSRMFFRVLTSRQ